MFRLYVFLGTLILTQCLNAQDIRKYGFDLENHLLTAEDEELVPLLIEGHPTKAAQKIKEYGGTIRLQLSELYSIEMPAKNIYTFSLEPAVNQIEFSNCYGQTLGDTMLVNTNSDSIIQNYLKIEHAPSGKNVLVGFIDSGIELNHPDFKDSLGRTRILHVWDQGVTFDPSRPAEQYNYGVEWDSSEINQGISTHDDKAIEFGHGSNVAGVAVSNGLAKGNYRGIAPDANIIVVATDFKKLNWLQTVAEAVDYIFTKADSLKMPCVINASVGTYRGSHDGLDIAARMIDRMIKEKEGRSMVCAAGNAGTFSFHLQHKLQQDTLFTWFENNPAQWSGRGGFFFEVWADTNDFNQIEFSIGADKQTQNGYLFRGRTAFDSINNRLNAITTDSLLSISGNHIATVQTYAEKSQGRYKLEFAIIDPDSSDYLLRIETRGSGKIDLWSSKALFTQNDMVKDNLPSAQLYPEMVHYKQPDSLQTMVSSFTCLPSVVTVGNYVNRGSYQDVSNTTRYSGVRPGTISINSSRGPNRKAHLKPDLSSSGDYMFSAGRLATIQSAIVNNPSKVSKDSMHYRNGGTSMAAPTVTGMIALLYERCPKANHKFILSRLQQHARKDQFTPQNPTNKWGYGKADAFQLIKSVLAYPKIQNSNVNYCVGDTALLYLKNTYKNVQWNNGDSNAILNISYSGNYFAVVSDSNGCISNSDTVAMKFLSLPLPMKIRRVGDTLSVPLRNGNYQWFKDQILLQQANTNNLITTQTGEYHCRYTDTNGCSIYSDTVNMITTVISESELLNEVIYLFPNPVHNNLNIKIPKHISIERLSFVNLNGRVVLEHSPIIDKQQFSLDVSPLNKGYYILRIISDRNIYHKKLLVE